MMVIVIGRRRDERKVLWECVVGHILFGTKKAGYTKEGVIIFAKSSYSEKGLLIVGGGLSLINSMETQTFQHYCN